MHGVIGHQQGIDQRGVDVRHRVGELVGEAGGPHELFGVGAVAHEPGVVRAVHFAAEVFLTGAAHVAFAAVEVRPEDDAVAHFKVTRARVFDDAAEFVAHPEIALVVRIPAFARLPHVDVGSAYARGGHADADVARLHFGNGFELRFDLFGADENGRLHHFSHYDVPSCKGWRTSSDDCIVGKRRRFRKFKFLHGRELLVRNAWS